MQRKQAVAHVVSHGLCSVRRACRYLGVHRSTYRYRLDSAVPVAVAVSVGLARALQDVGRTKRLGV